MIADTDELLREFVCLLTTDSVQQDRRRRDFNQAVFMENGKPVWTETTLDMVVSKYWKAVRNLERRSKEKRRESFRLGQGHELERGGI